MVDQLIHKYSHSSSLTLFYKGHLQWIKIDKKCDVSETANGPILKLYVVISTTPTIRKSSKPALEDFSLAEILRWTRRPFFPQGKDKSALGGSAELRNALLTPAEIGNFLSGWFQKANSMVKVLLRGSDFAPQKLTSSQA